MADMSVGKTIRERREAMEISQKHLAERACISQSNLCDIERGHRLPGEDSAFRLASILGIDKNYLEALCGRISKDHYAELIAASQRAEVVVSDAMVEAACEVHYSDHGYPWEGFNEDTRQRFRPLMRNALTAALAARGE